MKLILQPRDGLGSFLSAIRSAKKEIDLVIFRCDQADIEKAVDAAVKRGVRVRALIAHTNRDGENSLRKLEQRLLESGVQVARTGDEFVRYHGKFMIVDRSTLWVLGYNLTRLDTVRSRSFGIVTRQRSSVQQALKLFEADATRQPYQPAGSHLVVSPENARTVLADFIRKAKSQLWIYDTKIGDAAMIKLLKEREKAGVDVRIIGNVAKSARDLPSEKYPGKRLHVRAIIRDRRELFIGSQSLRTLELDKRREVGIIVKNAKVVVEALKTFDEDWALTDSGKRERKKKQAEASADEREVRAEA